MYISTELILADRFALGENIFKGKILLARAGTLITREIKAGLIRFGITTVKVI